MALTTAHSGAVVTTAQSPAADSPFDLKVDVEARIKPYINSSAKPPFELGELAVMAWVCQAEQSAVIYEKELFEWLVDTFRYYRRLSLRDAIFFEGTDVGMPYQRQMWDLAAQLSKRLLDVDVPMQRLPTSHRFDKRPRYTSTLASSRMFLRETLNGEAKRFTRFFDLPAELRLRVYEEALRSSGTLEYVDREFREGNSRSFGVSLPQSHEIKGKAASRDGGSQSRSWSPHFVQRRTKSSKMILGLLLANRQIFNEAGPVFYDINTFSCDIYGVVGLLRHCGDRRRQLFSRLEIDCSMGSPIGVLTSRNASVLLAKTKHLKEVCIKARDDDLPFNICKGEPNPHGLLHKVSLIKMLIGLETRSLQFASGSPKIEAYVQNKRSQMADDDSKAIARMKLPVKSRKRKVPMSAAFCTPEDNVTKKKARKRAVLKSKKVVDSQNT